MHICKLSDYFEITSSKRVFKSEWTQDGIPFYRAREIVKISKNEKFKDPIFISNNHYQEVAKKYGVPKIGDLLVTGVGTLGISLIIENEKPFYFKDGNIIWFKKKEEINSKYVQHYLNSPIVQKMINNKIGATVKTFTISDANNLQIPVPSLQEQEKIVERLDEIFKNIQNNLDMLNYLNTLITTKLEKSIFISECEKVDTKKLKVKEFSNIQGGGTPKTSVKEYWGGEIDFYTPKELSQHSDIEISSSSKKVTKLGLSKGAGKLLPVDTILFSSRAPIGYVAILKKEGSTNQGFQSFILKNQNDKYFFYFLLRNNKEYIESYAPGATFKDISKSRIEEIEFAIPSYEQQIEIGKKMVKVKNNIEKKSKLYKSNYEDLLKLRKSILDKEFSYE